MHITHTFILSTQNGWACLFYVHYNASCKHHEMCHNRMHTFHQGDDLELAFQLQGPLVSGLQLNTLFLNEAVKHFISVDGNNVFNIGDAFLLQFSKHSCMPCKWELCSRTDFAFLVNERRSGW